MLYLNRKRMRQKAISASILTFLNVKTLNTSRTGLKAQWSMPEMSNLDYVAAVNTFLNLSMTPIKSFSAHQEKSHTTEKKISENQ